VGDRTDKDFPAIIFTATQRLFLASAMIRACDVSDSTLTMTMAD
jgi:hypothetical protein